MHITAAIEFVKNRRLYRHVETEQKVVEAALFAIATLARPHGADGMARFYDFLGIGLGVI